MPEVFQRTLQETKMAASNHSLPQTARFLSEATGGTLIKTRAATGEECCTFQTLSTKKKLECKVRLSAPQQVMATGAAEPIWHLIFSLIFNEVSQCWDMKDIDSFGLKTLGYNGIGVLVKTINLILWDKKLYLISYEVLSLLIWSSKENVPK